MKVARGEEESFEHAISTLTTCIAFLSFLSSVSLVAQMRKTERVSVFPVAFSGGLSIEGPVCENGKVVKWVVSYAPKR